MNILITGSSGMLGNELVRVLSKSATVHAPARDVLDVRKYDQWEKVISHADVVIHCAAFTNVDAADDDDEKETLKATNVTAVDHLCRLCLLYGVRLIYPQTFLILAAQETVHPIDSNRLEANGGYAESKMTAEELVCRILPPDQRMVVRLGGFYGGGPNRDKNFVGLFLNRILPQSVRDGRVAIEVGDRVWQPTWTRDIADVFAHVVRQEWRPFYQYASDGHMTFADIARTAVETLDVDMRIDEVDASTIPSRAPRPSMVAMASSPELVEAGFVHECRSRLECYLREAWSGYNPLERSLR